MKLFYFKFTFHLLTEELLGENDSISLSERENTADRESKMQWLS